MFAKDQNNGLNNFSLGIKHICYTECKHVSLSVLNLKLIRYDGFVLHPLQVFFKNIQKYLFMQTDINMEMVLKIKNTGILGTVYEYDDAQS